MKQLLVLFVIILTSIPEVYAEDDKWIDGIKFRTGQISHFKKGSFQGSPIFESTIFYLKNRSPNEWNDVQSINSVQINLGKMSDSQLLNELRSDPRMVEALKNVIPQLADKQLIESND